MFVRLPPQTITPAAAAERPDTPQEPTSPAQSPSITAVAPSGVTGDPREAPMPLSSSTAKRSRWVHTYDSDEDLDSTTADEDEVIHQGRARVRNSSESMLPKDLLNPFSFLQKADKSEKYRLPTDPLPPLSSRAANEYDIFRNQITQVHSTLNNMRTNLRYHVRNPRVLNDLKITDLRAQLDEIEAIAVNKDTSDPHRNVRPYDKIPTPEVVFVDTTLLVVTLIDDIVTTSLVVTPLTPVLFMDSEGIDLGRNGTLTLVQIYLPTSKKVYLLDVQTLGAEAFTIIGTKEAVNLKHLLESPTLVKGWWDCRSDSDALYAHYEVELAGVIDLQLMENATSNKTRNNKTVACFDAAVGRRLNLSHDDLYAVSTTKGFGIQAIRNGLRSVLNLGLFGRDHDGTPKVQSSEVEGQAESQTATENQTENEIPAMAQRPLHPCIIKYCVQDVIMLPLLYDQFQRSKYWSSEWKAGVQKESKARLYQSRASDYDPSKLVMNAPPRNWPNLTRLDQTEYESGTASSVSPAWDADGF